MTAIQTAVMHTQTRPPSGGSARISTFLAKLGGSPARIVGRLVLLAWAGFWTWFIGASIVSEGLSAAAPGGGMLAAIWGLVLAAFHWPRAGSAVLLAAAGFTAWYFSYPGVWAIMALPMAVAALLMPWEGRRAA